jgi:dTDP-4-amino-4,6-dideoxygalactose transaminase
VKLRHLDEDLKARQAIADYYYDHIDNPLVELLVRLPHENNVYHLYPILVKNGKRDALQTYLAKNGLGTVIHYPIAPHKQECYATEAWNIPQLSLPVTERLADDELSLPMSPCMTIEHAQKVVSLINKYN